ncbi:MAG: tyrosine-type recombinase/integrase [Myxococcota bacterium]
MAAEVTPAPPSRPTARTHAKGGPASKRRRPVDTRIARPRAPIARDLEADPSSRAPDSPDTLASDTTSSAAQTPAPRISPQDSVDFLLHPAELAKGRRAAENYLSTFRTEESRRAAEEMLETLATVISGGKCDSVEFPWQQVRPYHGAAALTILKERGAPARIETLRCRKNSTRSFRAVPASYPPREVQKIRSMLTRVIQECDHLGFLVGETVSQTVRRPAKAPRRARTAPRHRVLGDGELRALIAASASDGTPQGCRDAVFFALVYRGLRIAEIVGLTIESVRFSNKSGACTITARASGSGARGRRVELTNDELICLEDWLDHRGNGAGPLLGSIGKNGKVEGKRLTTAMMVQICEERGRQAEVVAFTPTDLSRSADALTDHRKHARRSAVRESDEFHAAAERILFENEPAECEESEAIRFPFLGLGI